MARVQLQLISPPDDIVVARFYLSILNQKRNSRGTDRGHAHKKERGASSEVASRHTGRHAEACERSCLRVAPAGRDKVSTEVSGRNSPSPARPREPSPAVPSTAPNQNTIWRISGSSSGRSMALPSRTTFAISRHFSRTSPFDFLRRSHIPPVREPPRPKSPIGQHHPGFEVERLRDCI